MAPGLSCPLSAPQDKPTLSQVTSFQFFVFIKLQNFTDSNRFFSMEEMGVEPRNIDDMLKVIEQVSVSRKTETMC